MFKRMPSTLRSTIPPRQKLVLPLAALAACDWFLLSVAPPWFGLVAATFVSAALLILLLAILVPNRFTKGVTATPEGVVIHRPLRAPLSIVLADVQRVTAVSRGTGENGDALEFRLLGLAWSASVEDFDLYASGITERIFSMPGFSEAEWRRATEHEASLLDMFVGKTFVVYQAPARPASAS